MSDARSVPRQRTSARPLLCAVFAVIVVTTVSTVGMVVKSVAGPGSHSRTSSERRASQGGVPELTVTADPWPHAAFEPSVARALLEPPTTAPLPGDGKMRPLVIMGSQKCGTTTFHVELSHSPHVAQVLVFSPDDSTINPKECFMAWHNEHVDETDAGGASLRASPLYLTPQQRVNRRGGKDYKEPLLALDVSPAMYKITWYADFMKGAFGNETARMRFAAVLCDPAERAVSQYWHMVAEFYGAALREYNISVSDKLYADAKELNTCVRSLAPGYDATALSDDAILLRRGPMRYSSSYSHSFDVPEVLAMIRRDAVNGFPPLPRIDWAAVPDDWALRCNSDGENYVHVGLYAQLLRSAMYELVLRPLGAPFPTWSSEMSRGLLSPERQSRFLVIENAELFDNKKAVVDRVLRHAGLPVLYGGADRGGGGGGGGSGGGGGVDGVAQDVVRRNVHVHAEELHPAVGTVLREVFAPEMELLERMTQRGRPWFPNPKSE